MLKPMKKPKFKVGDQVIAFSENGTPLGAREIVEVLGFNHGEYHYRIAPTYTPWSSVPERELRPLRDYDRR
ncbi:hypothetical protein BrE312_1896 [Brenneria sp. EniD312]|nr:hypothetical protein BrE312_1896 [Brenneria sp. EniD312]PWC21484.1 hypothetical protein DDT54_18805 [Brenneria nigrifluens DSM 30175 = ATCC 13028]